jgi:UDP-N-acetylmuramyl pentapeptide phosphotransferase/UDP-N-acetylglucosamine-1-phosphate transferase
MIELDNIYLIVSILILLSSLITYIFNKNNILIDKVSHSKHKKLANNLLKSPSLCGGIITSVCTLLFFKDLSLVVYFGVLILFTGILSDSNKISSPKTRIFFQFIISCGFIMLTDFGLKDLRIETLNYLLNFNFISILFTVFCILILINGSNFLDGLNTLVLGYYSIVCFFLILLSGNYDLSINSNINLLLVVLLILYFLNFFEKIYLGDSGSYLIGFYISFFVIDFSLRNSLVSPYLICFFLWYPAFENLFSILRRMLSNNQVDEADQYHLHQMIYNYFINKKLIKNQYVNTLVANLINVYNLIIFTFFYKFYLNTKIIILATMFNILIYLIMYFFIKNKINQH